ncbi:hypothetical protein K491DRAFT_67148 [Lophiostoma macrostomum CBS 122681]|uniref:Uncharacterized protein n=1 Tax=Lophiostoma macrostomum CBS 122681 TaxID=1314788 RepID=A0A6A6SWM2_9PLEO|nr:hypothetical protein K491DRAFT_67148 [Lophiostoma macrostomum CBS 122681]
MSELTTTNLGPLTTPFTPASSCLGTDTFFVFTYGPLVDPLEHTDCFPPSFTAALGTGVYYSPGLCPRGYTAVRSDVHTQLSVVTYLSPKSSEVIRTEVVQTCCPRFSS